MQTIDSILPEIAALVLSLKPSPAWRIVRHGDPVDGDEFPTEAEAEAAMDEKNDSHLEVCPVSFQLTVGATQKPDGTVSWHYQTGDNSYSGGAYGHPAWGVAWISHESDPAEVAREIVDELAANL